MADLLCLFLVRGFKLEWVEVFVFLKDFLKAVASLRQGDQAARTSLLSKGPFLWVRFERGMGRRVDVASLRQGSASDKDVSCNRCSVPEGLCGSGALVG